MSSINLSTETMEELDSWGNDLIVLTLFEDERPLKGLNGLADWRYKGRLSRLVMGSHFMGRLGEKLLTNTSSYLKAKRVLMYGLGRRSEFNNINFVHAGEEILRIICGIKAESVLMTLPGTNVKDPYLLDRMAVMAKQIKGQFEGSVTIMVDPRENLSDLKAKFDLIDRELSRVVQKQRNPTEGTPRLRPKTQSSPKSGGST